MIVSVIIATYNRQDTILRAVQSALDQTLPPAEIIVVDDGSTDGTRELVEGLPRVRYIWQSNQRQSVARNSGLALSRGDVIATLDSDDWWDPGHLERALDQMKRYKAPVYCANWREIGLSGEVVCTDGMGRMQNMRRQLDRAHEEGILVLQDEAARWMALIHQPAPSSAMVIERGLIREWDTEMARWIREDLLLLVEAVLAGGRGMLLSSLPTWSKPVEADNLTNSVPVHQALESWLRGEQHLYRRVRSDLSAREAAGLRRVIAQLAFDHAFAVSRLRPLRSVPLFLEAFTWAPSVRPLLAALKQLPRQLRLNR